MKVKIIAALAVALLAFSLLACAGDRCSAANHGSRQAAHCMPPGRE